MKYFIKIVLFFVKCFAFCGAGVIFVLEFLSNKKSVCVWRCLFVKKKTKNTYFSS